MLWKVRHIAYLFPFASRLSHYFFLSFYILPIVKPLTKLYLLQTAISVSDPARFQALSSSLDFQHQAWAHGLAQHAEERRKEIEKEAMEKAAAGSGGITLQ